MKCHIIAVAGSIGSGKSTVSVALAEYLGWLRASFGDFVRAEARARGLPESRETLQDVGAAISLERGWDRFCVDTLAFAGWAQGTPAVVDGVRHVEALEALERVVAPAPLKLLFISTADAVRRQRLQARGVSTTLEQHRIESHSTEAQVESLLASRAALTVDGDRPTADIVQEVAAAFSLVLPRRP